MKDLFEDTICAPASAVGGAVAMIRVSGTRALEIVGRIFVPAGKAGSPLACSKGYTMRFGEIRDAEGRLIDEAVVAVFRAPASYTGENSVEISCHGSSYILQEILALLLENGARMAAPGEFTQRAFVNGKMDLSQAEAVADLIASQTEAAHKIALNQLKGGFSDDLASMRGQLLQIVSLMELELDFSEEDVEFADRSQLRELLDKVISHIESLISGFKLGNAIKNGVPVAIVGATNAGKSTLLNAIIGENRAIVSDIAGTTRDTIEETYNIDGVLFRFIDTAGLRRGIDAIEKIGIERAYEKLSEASLVLAVADLTSPLEDISSSASDILAKVSESQNVIFLLNKADSVHPDRMREVGKLLVSLGFSGKTYPISAKEKVGLQDFLKYIADTYKTLNATTETTLVTNVRHLEALKSAQAALNRVRQGLGADAADLTGAPDFTGATDQTGAPGFIGATDQIGAHGFIGATDQTGAPGSTGATDQTGAPGSTGADLQSAPVPTDLLAQDLREALYYLGTITGEITTDEVLGNIFRKFCIGK